MKRQLSVVESIQLMRQLISPLKGLSVGEAHLLNEAMVNVETFVQAQITPLSPEKKTKPQTGSVHTLPVQPT
jgi:hypothetical protein